MSATNFKFRYDEQEFAPPNGNARRKRNKEPNDTAHFMAGMFGGEPDSYNETPAFEEWDDAKLRQAGFIHKKTYSYRSPGPYSRTVYQVLRYEHGLVPGEKRFLQRMPTGDEVSDFAFFATAGYVKIAYNWPEVAQRKDEIVFFCEGEKDADRLMELGLLGSTIAGQNWTDTCARAYAGCDVWILEDNDKEGRANAIESANRLKDVARSIRIIRLPGLPHKGDVSYWLDAGHTKEELLRIGEATPLWEGKAKLFNPADWEGQPIPERLFLVTPLLLGANVTTLYGDGGNGKSLLALQLAVARATNNKWLGLNTTGGRTLVLSAEDDLNEMHRRIASIAMRYGVRLGDLGDIRLIDLVGQDAVIGELNRMGRIVATELFEFVLDKMEEFRPSVVIVDALADSFAGDENNRVQARQFISMLRGPAMKYNCAFLALAHPSLSGIATGRGTSGSTGWSNSVRARMYLETVEVDGNEPDPSLKVLRQPKANYAEPGFEIVLRYEDGVLVPKVDGEPPSRLAKDLRAEQVFMTILTRLFAQNRFVSDNSGPNYAPRIFASEPEAKEATMSKDQLKAAMTRLFEKNRIRMGDYGPRSRGKTRIEEAPL